MRHALIILCLFPALIGTVLPSCAAQPDYRATVERILAAINPNDQASWLAAEDALVNEGPAILPQLRQSLARRRASLCATTDLEARNRLAAEITVLNESIVRLTWSIDPRKAATNWLHAQKFADGRPFMREMTPILIDDERLDRIFPSYRFYLVYLPPYRGGAAPPEEILQQFAVPPPLERINILAVGKDGTVTLFTPDNGGMERFFRDHLSAVTTPERAKGAAYAWLRISTGFQWWNDAPLPFTIPVSQITAVKPATGPALTAQGTAIVIPANGNSGTLNITMDFNAKGKLSRAQEVADLHLATEPVLMIPSASPPGGMPGPDAVE